jgi:ABC-2 type transport system permease protein
MRLHHMLLRQVRAENRAFWRNPASAFFTFAFPLVFMVILNLVFASMGGQDALAFYTPSIIAFSIINAGFTTLAMSIAIARDEGILKRVHGTPLPTWAYLLARMIHSALMGLLLSVIVAAFGAIAFGVPIPWGQLPLVLVVLVVGAASFGALGLAVAGLVPSASAAPAVVNAIALPLLFISNIFVSIQDGILVLIGSLFPIRPFADALQALWRPEAAGPFDPFDIVFVAAWGMAGLLVAMRTFTWEPHA